MKKQESPGFSREEQVKIGATAKCSGMRSWLGPNGQCDHRGRLDR